MLCPKFLGYPKNPIFYSKGRTCEAPTPGERTQPLHSFFAKSHKRRRMFVNALKTAHGFFQAGLRQLLLLRAAPYLDTAGLAGTSPSPRPRFPNFPAAQPAAFASRSTPLSPPPAVPQPERRRQRETRGIFQEKRGFSKRMPSPFPQSRELPFAAFPSLSLRYLQSSRSSRRAGNIIKLQ